MPQRMPVGTLLLMALGFGFCVSANQLWRSALAGPVTDSAWAALFSCAAAMLCCSLYYFGKTRWLESAANLAILTVISSASLCVYFSMGGEVDGSLSLFLAGRLFDPCLLVLLVLWCVELIQLRMVDMVAATAMGFVAVALFQLSQAFFVPGAAIVASVAVPAVSSCLLAYCRFARQKGARDRNGSSSAAGDRLLPLGWAGETAEERYLGAKTSLLPYGKPILPVLIFSTMALYALMFTALHHLWTPVVGASENTMATLSLTALGSVLAAVLIAAFGKRSRCGTMDIVILLLSLVALYFSTLPLSALPLYLVFSNAAQKIIIFVNLLYGKNAPELKGGVVALCLAFAGYRLGLTLYPALSLALSSVVPKETLHFLCIVLCLGCLVFYVLYELLRSSDVPQALLLQSSQREGREESISPALLEHYKRVAFMHHLQGEYGFTLRELDIVPLALEGKNAGGIAKELVISNATAKSHLRNIYLKLDVHSQQELVSRLAEELCKFESEAESRDTD